MKSVALRCALLNLELPLGLGVRSAPEHVVAALGADRPITPS